MKRLWKWIKPILVIGLLLSFFYFVPIQDIFRALQSANFAYFLVSIILTIPIFYLSALTLLILTRKQQIHYSIWELLKMNLIIRFYSFFSPASILGSGMRWYQLSRGGKAAGALSAVAVDRALDILIAVLLGLFWFLTGVQKDAFNPTALFLLFVILVTSWFALTHWSPDASKWLAQKAEQTHLSWTRNLLRFSSHLFQSLSVYASLSAAELTILLGASILSELINLLIQVFLAFSLHIPISIVDLGWMRSLFFLASLAPFTLTGGIGLREVTIVLVMSAFGIPPELAGAYSLLSYARAMLVSLTGGIFELRGLTRKNTE
ncbi:MAG: flippase-like domain-containing protein [Chloroflexi bacterium]|nr:flippase-like domain-containing protein [Chloroflexota bacterium]